MSLLDDVLRTDAMELRAVLMRLAPHVAVQARNVSVAPENRADLLSIEPDLLKVLLKTKYLGDPPEGR